MPKRDSKGRYIKGSGKSKAGTSIVKRQRGGFTVVEVAKAPAAKSKSKGKGGGGGGVGSGWLPPTEDLWNAAGAGAYGFLERAWKAGPAKDGSRNIGYSIIEALPKPVDSAGLTGNVALSFWGIAKLTRNKWAGRLAKGTLAVAFYKLGARGEAFKNATDVSGLPAGIGNYDDDDTSSAGGYFDPHDDTYQPD